MTHRNVGFLLNWLVACSLLPNIVSAAPITGTISLPGAQTASGTMYIAINAFDTSGSQSGSFTPVIISAGDSSAPFSLDSIPDDPSATWRISYTCLSSFDACLDYVLTGYYDSGSPGDVSYKESAATTVSQGQSGVEFEVLEGINIAGSLTSPLGNAGVGGIDVRMFFTDTGFAVSNDVKFEIAEGQDSVDFSVTMPDDVALNYRVRYNCDTTGSASDNCTDLFLSNGYYQSSAPNNTVSSQGGAQSLAGNASHANIDMELLTGASISGVISRIGSAGTAHDVTLSLRATDETEVAPDAFNTVTIPSGSSSIAYNLVVQNTEASNWVVSAFCNAILTPDGCADYGEVSYFDADTAVTQSTANKDHADLLAGNTLHTDIDFTLVRAKSISGVLMLPDSKVAPTGGIDLFLTAQEFTGGVVGANNANAPASILAGQNFTNYSIPVPDDPSIEWRVSINCDTVTTPASCEMLTPNNIFYDLDNSPDFSTINPEDADVVSGANDITGVNMVLITAALAQGTVFLGDEQVAPAGGLVVRFRGRGYDVDDMEQASAFKLLTIAAGENSALYSLGLTQLDDIVWTIEIECDDTNPSANCAGYEGTVYYAADVPETSSSIDPLAATLLDTSALPDPIDITLLARDDELCVPIKSTGGNVVLLCL